MTELVRVETAAAVATVTLNRPEARNALDEALMDVLLARLEGLAADPGVRCVILTGAGAAFCAGGDVKERRTRWAEPPPVETFGQRMDALVSDLRRRSHAVELLHSMPKPVIAMVNGAAAGAGFALALACDFRVIAESAFATTAYAANALCGDFGISYFLTRMVGPTTARRLLMLPERLDAGALEGLGLATRVVPLAELRPATDELARRLAAGPTYALGKMKRNLAVAESGDLAAVLDIESYNTRLTGLTEDGREATAALGERREPRFTGG